MRFSYGENVGEIPLQAQREVLAMIEVEYMRLPETIRGAVTCEGENDYLILINSTLSVEAQAEALAHEMRHITLGHFDSNAGIQEIERGAADMRFLYGKMWAKR